MFPQDQVRRNQTSRLVRSEGCASAIRLQTSNVSELSGHLVQMISDTIRPLVTFLMSFCVGTAQPPLRFRFGPEAPPRASPKSLCSIQYVRSTPDSVLPPKQYYCFLLPLSQVSQGIDRSRGGQWCSVCFLLFVHYLAQLS